MTDAAALIDVRGWAGERGGVLLWGPLDLRVCAGDVVHVQGPNGSGKTTLLRTLAGLRPPALAAHTALCHDAWWVGHASPLADELDAAANLRLWLQAAAAPVPAEAGHTDTAHLHARLHAYLHAQGVPQGRPVRQLSAGQRRKLALAPLALAPRALWLLDEPFDALDTAACTRLAAQATSHVARGGAIVLTSHQPLPPGFPAARLLRLG